MNLDAYRDILTVMHNKTDNTHFFRIVMNKPNKTEGVDPYKNSYFDHGNSHRYINYTDVDYVSFFDLDENGQLDIMMVRKVIEKDEEGTNENKENENEKNANNTLRYLDTRDSKDQKDSKENSFKNKKNNGEKVKYISTGFFNIEAYDNFFLKSLLTKSKINFFSADIGTNYRYYVTDLNGNRKLRVGVQHPQTSCLNLELPYTFEGIGLSYNYVENFHVSTASPKNTTGNYMNLFTPIIPNSQLLIYNYDQYGNEDWELDLIVTPISKITLVVIVICIILFILLIIIITLHCMEKVRNFSGFFWFFFFVFLLLILFFFSFFRKMMRINKKGNYGFRFFGLGIFGIGVCLLCLLLFLWFLLFYGFYTFGIFWIKIKLE